MRLSKTVKIEKLNKKIKELETMMNLEENNMKSLIQNFTNYTFDVISKPEAWYIIEKENKEITIDSSIIRPEDIEEWVWNQLTVYAKALEMQYKRYVDMLNEYDSLKAA